MRLEVELQPNLHELRDRGDEQSATSAVASHSKEDQLVASSGGHWGECTHNAALARAAGNGAYEGLADRWKGMVNPKRVSLERVKRYCVCIGRCTTT